MDNDQTNNLDPQNSLQPDDPTLPIAQGILTGGKTRRDFLKAAVIASAAVAATGGAAGAVLAARGGPQSLLRFGPQTASGQCIPIKQGGKFGGSNPNNFIQVDNSYLGDFGTAAATKDANGNFPLTFTRCGSGNPIHFTLTDKTGSHAEMQGDLVETGGQGGTASYKDGNNGVLFLAFTNISDVTPGGTTNEYPTGSCLALSCS